MKTLLISILLILVFILGSCGNFGYYSQSINGHLSIMSRRLPISDVLADPDTPAELAGDLRIVLEVRTFAEDALHMPVNESFRTYAEIDRPYAVWNVVAAPAYSLAAYEWCFPVAGCLPYRGYFRKGDAERFADSLEERGLDAFVYGVPAYSTLGWFDDPVLSTFVDYPEWALAGLIFHELAHQMVYAESDGDFNEAFASAIEQEGVKRWLLENRSAEALENYLAIQHQEELFYQLISATRGRLLGCFDGRNGYPLEEQQGCKDEAFAEMKERYLVLKSSWNGSTVYDRWFDPGLNNARFISSHTYRFYIPAFQELLRRQDGNLQDFYRATEALAKLPAGERKTAMTELRNASIAAISDTSKDRPAPVK